MPEAGESEAGLFALSSRAYHELLPQFAATVRTGDGTSERNFLPFLGWMHSRGTVVTFPVVDELEAVGINTPEELATVEAYLQRRGKSV
jgi:hypothetical protein